MKKNFTSINRPAVLAAMVALFLVPAATRAQSLGRLNQTAGLASEGDDLNAQALAALRRLEHQVIVYRSLGEFEENGRLARVPLQTFAKELRDVTLEIQPIVRAMPPGKLRNEIVNALASYRDGLFWWRKMDQPRVINVSDLRYDEPGRSPADRALLSDIPYTVAIHWRQAAEYLKRAEALIEPRGN